MGKKGKVQQSNALPHEITSVAPTLFARKHHFRYWP
jgi:hypothetical protein